jgi:hypothetical protein
MNEHNLLSKSPRMNSIVKWQQIIHDVIYTDRHWIVVNSKIGIEPVNHGEQA